jgi:hypothetical protein
MRCVQSLASLGLVFSCTGISTFAQLAETHSFDQWPLGEGALLDFTQGTIPVAVQVPIIYPTLVAVGCDRYTGELVFTAERSVYDRNGTLLDGTQNELICIAAIPHPGQDSIWYLFSFVEPSLKYWVFDRRLRGGLGDMTEERDVPLFEFAGDIKLLGISSDDGSEYRVLAHQDSTDHFVEFVISAADGLNTTPFVAPIGATIEWNQGNSVPNSAAVSPNNRRLALTGFFGVAIPDHEIWLLDVDPNNGTISNAMEVPLGDFSVTGSRMAFSPNSQMLYVPIENCPTNDDCGDIMQYDVSLPTPAEIASSGTILYENIMAPGNGTARFRLSLGPDGVIYAVSTYHPYFWSHALRIMDPDNPGAQCAWDTVGLTMPVEATLSFELPWTFWPQQNTTGINMGDEISNPLVISPNPASTSVTFNWAGVIPGAKTIQVRDASGRLVAVHDPISSWSTMTVDVSNLATGLYSASLLTDTGILRAPMVIAR